MTDLDTELTQLILGMLDNKNVIEIRICRTMGTGIEVEVTYQFLQEKMMKDEIMDS